MIKRIWVSFFFKGKLHLKAIKKNSQSPGKAPETRQIKFKSWEKKNLKALEKFLKLEKNLQNPGEIPEARKIKFNC